MSGGAAAALAGAFQRTKAAVIVKAQLSAVAVCCCRHRAAAGQRAARPPDEVARPQRVVGQVLGLRGPKAAGSASQLVRYQLQLTGQKGTQTHYPQAPESLHPRPTL